MDIIKIVTVLSVVIEALTNTMLLVWNIISKPLAKWSGEEKKDIITIVISVIISIGVSLDVFNIAGIPFKIPVLGSLLTGLLFARGAGVITDILDIIYYAKVNKKVYLEITKKA